jgi:hypothetical protein
MEIVRMLGSRKMELKSFIVRGVKKYQQRPYRNKACERAINPMMAELLCESVCICAIG